ncbi:hypothetical protein GCM10010174_29640 [Kutzneria viridogrisea]
MKRIIVAATTVLAVCGLAGGPASAASPTIKPIDGPVMRSTLFLLPEPNFSGSPQRVVAPVPFRCTPVDPNILPDGAHSAFNDTRQYIALFAKPPAGKAPCEATPVIELSPSNPAAEFPEPVFYFKAFLR